MPQNYKIDFLSYTDDNSVRSDCADITFVNNGATTIILNNTISIAPGSSLSLAANAGEIDRTIYNFYFITSGTRAKRLVVFRKIYV